MKISLGVLLSLIAISVNAMQTIEVEKPVFVSFASENNAFLSSEKTDLKKDQKDQVLVDNSDKKILEIIEEFRVASELRMQDLLNESKESSAKYEKIRKEEEEKRLEFERQLAKKPNARIGMTKNQILNQSNWGQPYDINTTIDAYGTFEQWIYDGDQYLYFTNGRLTTIQQ